MTAVIDKYALGVGPQTRPFGRLVLVDSYSSDGSQTSAEDLDAKLNALGFGPEGDRELVETILDFSRLLLEKCGNRSLYSSSERLGDLLNTTSLSLLHSTLRLALCLAQRYHARHRGVTHIQPSLLATHYNIDLDKLQKVAGPFPRPFVSGKPSTSDSPAISAKGKEKGTPVKHNANDLIILTRENDGWDEWGHVRVLYYPSGAPEKSIKTTESVSGGQASQPPSTPTPLRRSATQPTPRLSRTSNADDSPGSAGNTPSAKQEETLRDGKTLDIPYTRVSTSKSEELLASHLGELPNESKYELLHRIRTAKGLATSHSSREQVLAIRALAISNLAYVYPEPMFQQKILQYDMEQPKRLQLAYQLAELVHLGASGDLGVSRAVQTLAVNTLDALAKIKSRSMDVCAALSINVNHGVLMFLARKMVNELGSQENDNDGDIQDEWRDALLGLLRTLPNSSTRTPETLVAAGIIPMFVDVLNLRTKKARRAYARVMEFLDTFVHTVRDALGTLTSAKGFDAMSDLIEYETKSAYEAVGQGAGIPAHHKTPAIDYQIPYFQQQTLRSLFRFVNHIMQHNGGGYDRVLRNLIDSPQLLTSLRLVFENTRVFGSHVWSNTVNILSSFIHNEPTSYAVIAEAGLSRSFLEAVMLSEVKAPEKPPAEAEAEAEAEAQAQAQAEGEPSSRPGAPDSAPAPANQEPREYTLVRPKDKQLAVGILPAAEALSCIPSAFGAICLNASGLQLFQSSDALESFFEIFESPDHVKCLKDDPNLVRSLGTTFDELARHHPALKSSIITAVIVMVARIGILCRTKAWRHGMGTKLWAEGSQAEPVVSGGINSLFEEIGADTNELGFSELSSTTLPNGGKLKVGDLSTLTPSETDHLEPKDVDGSGLTAADYLFPVVRFLGAFFENQPNCTYFLECGGIEFVLDFATLQSLTFDFHNTDANRELTELVHMLAETKPHLVIPSLLHRAQTAVDSVSNFWSEPNESGFFSSLIKPINEKAPERGSGDEPGSAHAHGTRFAKHMGAALVLTDLLREVYSLPVYQTRPSHQTSAFVQVVLADKYCSLVTALGKLHAACVWEEIVLEKNIPDTWDQATKVQPPGTNLERSNNASGPSNAEGDLTSASQPQREGETTEEPAQTQGPEGRRDSKPKIPEDSIAFKNVQTLRYLLSSLPSSIAGFFHNLGLGLIGKRRMDQYQKQSASMVADQIAKAVLDQLQFGPPNSSSDPRMRFAYLIVILSSFSHMLYEPTADRHSHYLTVVLFAFKRNNGLKVMKDICNVFVEEVKALTPSDPSSQTENDVSARLTSAYGGIKIILAFFAELASGKHIVDSSQTQTMTGGDRDRDRPDYFQPGQFLVDLRMEILPIARDLWNSEFAVKSSSSVVKCLVDILRSSLDGEYESGAASHSEPASTIAELPRKTLVINKERIASLQEKGYDKELIKEALYRCNNAHNAAEEYCNAQNWLRPPPRFPPPANEIESVRSGTTVGGDLLEDTAVADAPPFNGGMLERSALAMLLAQTTGQATNDGANQDQAGATENGPGHGADYLARALNHILNEDHNAGDEGQEDTSNRNHNPPAASSSEPSNPSANQPLNRPSEQSSEQPKRRREVATIDDLDAEREKIRSNLIERCLDVLNEHHDVSFELSDLIASATKKHRDPGGFRRDVGEILVQSLVSLQMEDFQAAGKKIAAYAHLLALVLQDRDMYNATLEELKACFEIFLGFVKIPSPEKAGEESFPWIGHVLLILEKLLSDDAQPPQIRWNPPSLDNPSADDEGPAQLEEALIPHDQKMQLFEGLVEILPRVGKDDALALSVCRVLVILTRSRTIASRLGEKRSLQRLFVMVKQLSSTSSEKLQSAFMLILRHVVEDEETIRQIMRNDIVSFFESKPNRQIDTTGFVRQMYHLVLRAPELFVQVTNEKLKLQRYDSHQRPQSLTLKPEKTSDSTDTSPSQEGTEQENNDGANAGGERSRSEDKEKSRGTELKMPVVENPDGVIHYLLSELLSYKDVDDKESPTETTETTGNEQSGNQTDVEMSIDDPAPSVASTDLQAGRTSKRTERLAFKADDHPIYIYRCFLLQCLTELLSSYNRTKIEFINFSRKADPHGATPQKPRSGILNYLLNVLVPIGTMDHDESVSFKKRSNTSVWTMRVLVALCTKTGEFGGTGKRRPGQKLNEEDEPELAFVRRFVLEHALRSYKDANSSNEMLDAKYSRLMSLADLFDKMLSDYTLFSGDSPSPSSRKQLEKTMFEKHFIGALSGSLADIDLNFPAARRVIKHILRPLNKLTRAAVTLSQTSDISSLGETEEDEISSATSVSDMEDEREETPDLFRHSTLGMLEPRHEEETSSEESGEEDDEMYEDEYDEEMDYDEDMPENNGEVVSDEEDDEGGMGPIEGLPGDSGMDIEVVIDEDEDEDDDDEGHDEGDEGTEDDEIYAGEITGDRDNESLEEGGDDEWESEEEMFEDDEEAEMMNEFEDELAGIRHAEQRGGGHRLDDLFRVLNQAAGGVEDLHGDDGLGDLQDDMVDDGMDDEDDDEIDELEEELDDIDDQASYQFDEDDAIDPWWDGDDLMPPRGPHHHRFRGPPPAFTAVTGIMPGRPGVIPIQPYRTHRAQVPGRGADDGTNPLLVRTDQPPEAIGPARGPGNEPLTDWVHGMEPLSAGRLLPVDSPVSFMNAIMQVIGGQSAPGFGVVTRPDGIHVHVDRQALAPNHLQDIFGLGRPQPPPVQARDDPSQAVSFGLASTKGRWQEEARLLFSSAYVEKTQRVVNSVLKMLVPPAIEEEKQRQKQMEEERKRREEERAEKERQDRAAREEEEKERARKEEEENAKREQEREQQEAERQAAGEVSEPMDDVQQTETAGAAEPQAQAEGVAAEPARRVHTTIRGRQLDITGMEIDPEYLEALPEELREEVIMQQLAEQRSQAAAAGEEPSEINPEFLEALPPEIREELLQQEAADRRRRERENARRQTVPAGGGPAAAEDMDAASFLATLDPSLRQTVIAEQPEDFLAGLGPEYLSEARALTGRRLAQFGDIGRVDHRQRNEPDEAQEPKRPQRRQIVQMLDKAGVATLVRLMFMPLQGNARHQLNDILQNICENRQNRIEVISLLLSVLQDGSSDISAIERSFAQLSLRAKAPSTQKTPQSVKRNVLFQSSSSVSSEATPLMVVQQCLGTLSFLSQYNPHIAWFFLTEHDPSSTLKLKAFRKGKAKENRANKFALNALLSLLDRSLIMESTNCMEQLSTLLSSITQPLTLLLRREKEKQEGEKGEQPDRPQEPEERGQPVQPSETTEPGVSGGDTTMRDAPLPTVEGTEPETETAPQVEEEASADATKASEEKKQSEDKKPKRRTLEPPVVPDSHLRLVVLILAARECNSRAFRDTLSTINNLSVIPGARDVFGEELVKQAQNLSTTILADLDELLPYIHQAKTGTDMQGLALAKFSPASSDQAKLLRILTALDYLFDPNRVDKVKGLETDSTAKEDSLKALYESATFGPLWNRLSECLTVIRHKENMLNVATILLPLIEALMVVCKNTALKDTPVSRNSRELSVSSATPESGVGMESLFFKFTEEHRKILNELVRQNPKLMSGTFSLLVKNPKVLEFDNKRNYFTRRVHSRGAEPRHPHAPLQLSVRRDQVFLDSFKSLYFKTADELKHGKLNVRFHGEEGVDAGGVTREWFQVLARGMFNPNYALFIPVAADRTTFHPNRLSGVNSEHLMFFKFIGRIIGKALYEGRVLDCHFSRAVYKCILGRNVSIKDMETLDLDYYKSLLWMCENDITDIITETFSLETDDFGEKQVIDLKENGRNIPVTQENKEEYVQRVVDYRLVRSVKEQLDNFLKGMFYDGGWSVEWNSDANYIQASMRSFPPS